MLRLDLIIKCSPNEEWKPEEHENCYDDAEGQGCTSLRAEVGYGCPAVQSGPVIEKNSILF